MAVFGLIVAVNCLVWLACKVSDDNERLIDVANIYVIAFLKLTPLGVPKPVQLSKPTRALKAPFEPVVIS